MTMLLLYILLGFSCANYVLSASFPVPAELDKHIPSPAMLDNANGSFRLPRDLIPYKYDLIVEPHMYSEVEPEFYFSGRVKILMKCKRNTRRITLHARSLEINASSVKVWRFRTKEYFNVSEIKYDSGREFTHFIINGSLAKTRLYHIEMAFTGQLRRDLRGMYLSSYYEGDNIKYLAATTMSPSDARKAFPCFDEPNMKAVFNISLIRPEGWIALSNGQKIAETRLSADTYIDHFALTPKMSTYLVAMVVCQFKHLSKITTNGTELRIWSTPGVLNRTRTALEISSQIQTFFEDYLETKFVLPKLDMIALPQFRYSGMENWGLITYKTYFLTISNRGPTDTSIKDIVEVIAHEVAHQWFGNLVTPDWWSDLWLKEGFATFCQYIGSGHAYPEWNQRESSAVENMETALQSDSNVWSHPLHKSVSTQNEVADMFSSISYRKGGAIFRMMEHFLGRETFRKGLVNYLKKNKFGNTVPDDVWFAMGNQSLHDGHPVDVKRIMDTWIYQMNYPVVMVTQDNDGSIRVTQKRCLYNSDDDADGENPSPYGYIWNIPFTYTTSSDRNFNKTESDVIFINRQENVIRTSSLQKDNWIIANIQEFGYYRVNYNADNWYNLVKQMENDREIIHPINRAKFVNDAWALSNQGELSQEIADKISEVMWNDENSIVLDAFSKEINRVENLLSGTEAEHMFKTFAQDSVRINYTKYGIHSVPRTMEDAKRRKLIVDAACKAELDVCVSDAIHLYQKWTDNANGHRIPPDIQKTVFCTALGKSGQKEWDFAFSRYKKIVDTVESKHLIEGLACTKSSVILIKFLHLTLEPTALSSEDVVTAFEAISKNPVGRKLVLPFLNENWDTVEDRFGKDSFYARELVNGMSEYFHTKGDLQQMESIQSRQKGFAESAILSFNQNIEKTKENINWMKNNYPVILKWLKNRQT